MNFLLAIMLGSASRISGSPYKYFGIIIYCSIYAIQVENILLGLLIFGCVFLGKITGHADGFQNYVRDNFLSKYISYVTNLLRINRNSKLYDSIFWAVKGGLIALAPAIILSNPYLFITSLLGYPLAYHLGFNYLGYQKLKGEPSKEGNFNVPPYLPLPKKLHYAPTEWGETLAGFFAGLGFLL